MIAHNFPKHLLIVLPIAFSERCKCREEAYRLNSEDK